MTPLPALPTPDFSTFYRHAPLNALLQAYAAARPQLVALSSLGQSWEGREITLVTLTDSATGAAEDKPAIWVDGNIHAGELTASTACLYWLHQLLAAHDAADPQVRHLLATRTVYLCPRLNPDGAELALADKPRFIRSSTRPYPWDEAPVDGLDVEDVDGDGRVLMMRVPDPNGGWKAHPEQPRLLVPREPGEVGGSYWRVMPEGTLRHYDGLQVKVNPDREGLDLNRNFPAQWRPEAEQPGAGPYPTSEPEVRAMVDFIARHPNIGAAVSFHTHSGVILRPMGTQSDEQMAPEDLWMIKRFSALGEQHTGYPAISIFHDFKYHPKEVVTGTQDWVYEHLGALFWVVELWAPNREAGITDYDFIHWYRDHPVADDLKLLAWSDSQCGGRAHVDWYPFRHPQLGMVELGGWDRLNYWRNPPPELREREVAKFPAWLNQIALSLPQLTVLRTEVRALGHDTWRLRFAVANAGYLPSHITRRALERKVVRGTVFEIELPEGASLLGGKHRMVGPHLDGHAPKNSLQAFMPMREVTGDRAVAEWVVCAPRGTQVRLQASADRAGRVHTEVTLD